jgi:integrase
MVRREGRLVAPGIHRVERGLYLVRVRVRDQRTGRREARERLVKGTQVEASKAREALRLELEAELADERHDEGVTLRAFSLSWLASMVARVRSSTARHYAEVLEHHIDPSLGLMKVVAIRRSDIDAWVAEQLQGPGRVGARVSPETVNTRLRVLKEVLRSASEDLGIPDPSRRVRPLPAQKPDRRRRDGLSLEQLRAVLLEARRELEWWPLVLLLSITGMRWGEATALQWGDIDEDRRRIWIRRSQRHGVVSLPKTSSVRWFPLPAELSDVLREHRARLLSEQHPGLAAGWVFATAVKGEARLRYTTSAAKAFKRWARAAGIERPFSPHDLRRSCVDLMRVSGGEALLENALLGHGEPMRKRYSTVGDAEAGAVVGRMLRLVDVVPEPSPGADPGADPKAEKG